MKPYSRINLRRKLDSAIKKTLLSGLGVENEFNKKLIHLINEISLDLKKPVEEVSIELCPHDLDFKVILKNKIAKEISPTEFLNLLNLPANLHATVWTQINNCLAKMSLEHNITLDGLIIEFSLNEKRNSIIRLFSNRKFVSEITTKELISFFL